MFHMSRRSLVIILIITLVLCVYAWYASDQALRADARRFGDAYKTLSDAAFLPGAAGNPVRAAANRALAEVLTGSITPAERIERSRDGQALLKEIEQEIDVIPEARAAADSARERLVSRRYSLGGLRHVGSLRQIDGIAEEQARLVEDIRGLSYGANYHTDKIFARVVDDGGVLADSFVASLNDEIPQVEEQFNRRSNLYAELQQVDYRMETLLEGLGVPR